MESFGQKVLKHYWPQAIPYHDITKTDFTIHRGTIDVLTGGFPCQPFSVSGEQLGKEHSQYLVEEMLRAIREIKPRWVVAENVIGITSKKFESIFEYICSSVENEGYQIQPVIIPATSVEAEHERYRTWFIAYSGCKRLERPCAERKDICLSKRTASTIISSEYVLKGCPESLEDGKYLRIGDGIPDKLHKESIKALGNAIVPQVALQIFKAIEEIDNQL